MRRVRRGFSVKEAPVGLLGKRQDDCRPVIHEREALFLLYSVQKFPGIEVPYVSAIVDLEGGEQ